MGPWSPTFRRGPVQPRKRLSGRAAGSRTKMIKKRPMCQIPRLRRRRQDHGDCVDVDEAANHDDEANLIRVLFTDLGASNVTPRAKQSGR